MLPEANVGLRKTPLWEEAWKFKAKALALGLGLRVPHPSWSLSEAGPQTETLK